MPELSTTTPQPHPLTMLEPKTRGKTRPGLLKIKGRSLTAQKEGLRSWLKSKPSKVFKDKQPVSTPDSTTRSPRPDLTSSSPNLTSTSIQGQQGSRTTTNEPAAKPPDTAEGPIVRGLQNSQGGGS